MTLAVDLSICLCQVLDNEFDLSVIEMFPSQKVLFVRICLFVGMITCFTATSYRNFQKYVEGRSSMTESLVKVEKPEPLPTFSICAEPAFDIEYMENELKVPPNLFLFTSILGQVSGLNNFPQNLSTNGTNSLEKIWNDTAVKPDVFAINDTYIIDDEMTGNMSDVELFDPINSLWYGRCSSIVLKRPRMANERLIMIFAFLGK